MQTNNNNLIPNNKYNLEERTALFAEKIIDLCKKANDKRQEKFLKKLSSFGYEVKTRDVKYIHTKDGARKMKGNLDAEMILDMVTRKDTYDTLLLFSGDSDFAVILEYLKSQKKRVLVASVKGHVSKELLNQAKYINLKQLRKELSRN